MAARRGRKLSRAYLPTIRSTLCAEDPVRKGLLFAGTERAVHVSFNDGDNWHPLRLNMPATSIRDLVVHNDDVVVGTHGRSFWILDDVTPLRQINADVTEAEAFLFKPQIAYRVRNNLNTDTPLPPEEPGGKNPPDGAILNYFLKGDAKTVTLEVFDAKDKLVRRCSSSRIKSSRWMRKPWRFPRTGYVHRKSCRPNRECINSLGQCIIRRSKKPRAVLWHGGGVSRYAGRTRQGPGSIRAIIR